MCVNRCLMEEGSLACQCWTRMSGETVAVTKTLTCLSYSRSSSVRETVDRDDIRELERLAQAGTHQPLLRTSALRRELGHEALNRVEMPAVVLIMNVGAGRCLRLVGKPRWETEPRLASSPGVAVEFEKR